MQLLPRLVARKRSSEQEELVFWTSSGWLGGSGFIKRKREEEVLGWGCLRARREVIYSSRGSFTVV